jgi:hypothetical protein
VGDVDKIVTDWWGNKVRLQKLWNDAYNFMLYHKKADNISKKDFDKIMGSLSGSGEERALQLDKSTYDLSWKDEKGYRHARYPNSQGGKTSKSNRRLLSTIINRAVQRAEEAGDKKSEAHKILKLYKSNPYFPTDADDLGKVLDLRTRGVGIEPSVKGRTFRWTPEAGKVPTGIRTLEGHIKVVNRRLNELVASGQMGLKEADGFRLSGGHGLPKGAEAWPQLRNAMSNVFLQPYMENVESGSKLTSKDVNEYIRMNERMVDPKTGIPGVGASKGGLKNAYAFNDYLLKNNLPPLPNETIGYFKDLPNVRSWKSVGQNIVSKTGRPVGNVGEVVKRSLMNMLESPGGQLALKAGKYGLKAVPFLGYGAAAKGAVDYGAKHPILSTISGLSAVPGLGDVFGLPLLGAEVVGNIWNRDKELMEKRKKEPRVRKPGRGYGLLNN